MVVLEVADYFNAKKDGKQKKMCNKHREAAEI